MSKYTQLSTATASNTGSVTLTGITSEYPVAILYYDSALPATDGADLMFRLRESGGSDNSNSNYNSVIAYQRSDRDFDDEDGDNLGLGDKDKANLTGSTHDGANQGYGGILYIHNAANGSEATYVQSDTVYLTSGSPFMLGQIGGTVLREATTVTGITLFYDTGNIATGNFTLVGIKN